jgi:hypothetical protein
MARPSQRKIRSLSPWMIRCRKCGRDFDPRVQASACHAGVAHYPIVRISEWQPPSSVPADKPKQRAEFQSDFQQLWNESQSHSRVPK